MKSAEESLLLPSMTNAEMVCPDVTTNIEYSISLLWYLVSFYMSALCKKSIV